MSRLASTILLAFFVACYTAKGDVQCPVCTNEVPQCCTIHNCGHKFCIVCTTKILSVNYPTCPLCRSSIIRATGTGAYEQELSDFKRAVLNNQTTPQMIIARFYLLPPWQVPDSTMLLEVKARSYNKVVRCLLIQRIRNNLDGYSLVEDVAERSKLFSARPNKVESDILSAYYERCNCLVHVEMMRRNNAYGTLLQ